MEANYNSTLTQSFRLHNKNPIAKVTKDNTAWLIALKDYGFLFCINRECII